MPESLTKPSQVLEFTRAARASRHSADSVPEMPKHLTEAATFEDMLDLTVAATRAPCVYCGRATAASCDCDADGPDVCHGG